MKLSVYAPFVMDETEQNEFKKILLEKLKTEIVVDFHVDTHLIGGILVRTGHFVLDDSVQNKLRKLKGSLISR